MVLVRDKSAQLTIFIIIGIVILAAVVTVFFLIGPKIELPWNKTLKDPTEKLKLCIEDSIKSSEKEFFERGIPSTNNLNYLYNRSTVPFLCYATEYYVPCIPQSPLLIEVIRKKMENAAARELSKCLLSLKEDYENRGYSFQYSDIDFSIIFNELSISYVAELGLVSSKGSETISINREEGLIFSILPKMLRTTETIINYESTICEFNYITWQAMNRGVGINRFRGGDQTKVYILKDRESNKEIKFAVRTCVLPAGI